MSRKYVYAALRKSGIPFTNVAWPSGSAPSLPWGVYVEGESSDFYADDARLVRISKYTVELYQKTADNEVEKKVEEAIGDIAIASRGEQVWIPSENCIMTPYYFDLIERN